jgi:hypothetical protein
MLCFSDYLPERVLPSKRFVDCVLVLMAYIADMSGLVKLIFALGRARSYFPH